MSWYDDSIRASAIEAADQRCWYYYNRVWERKVGVSKREDVGKFYEVD